MSMPKLRLVLSRSRITRKLDIDSQHRGTKKRALTHGQRTIELDAYALGLLPGLGS